MLLVEEGLRLGVPLERALEAVQEWKAGVSTPAGGTAAVAPVDSGPSEAQIIAQNQRALAELSKMMPGLGV